MYASIFLYMFAFTEIDEASKQTVLCNVRQKLLCEWSFHVIIHTCMYVYNIRFVSGCFHWDTHFVLVSFWSKVVEYTTYSPILLNERR